MRGQGDRLAPVEEAASPPGDCLWGWHSRGTQKTPPLNHLKFHTVSYCFFLRVWCPLKYKYLWGRNRFLHLHFSMKELLNCFLTMFWYRKGWKCMTSQGTKEKKNCTFPRFSRKPLWLWFAYRKFIRGSFREQELWGRREARMER